MLYIKINNTIYPATINGRIADMDWDNRESKAITLEMDYQTALNLFVDGLKWSIVQNDGEQEYEFDNSDYNIAGDLTNHRDGTVTAKMGKLTELEEAYEIMLGGI
jgi:hypothetical protein